jgi:hypothetical protein
MLALALVLVPMATSAIAVDDSDPVPVHLPKPLDHVALDLGPFAADFDVAESAFLEEGEFETPDPTPRVVQEETIRWTLAANRDLSADELRKLIDFKGLAPADARKLLEGDGRRLFHFRVVFSNRETDQESDAGARVGGYYLATYWDRNAMRKGDKLQVWTHLGDAGADGLVKTGATHAVIQSPIVPGDAR